MVVLVGFVIALIGLGVAAFEIIDYFVEPEKTVPGYTSLAVLMLVLTGVIIYLIRAWRSSDWPFASARANALTESQP